MTRPRRVGVRERTADPAVASILEQLEREKTAPVAPPADRFAVGRFAVSDRFAAESRFAVASRFAVQGGPVIKESERPGRFAAGGKRKLVRRVVVVGGIPPRTGRAWWLPSWEYERCFEREDDGVWPFGAVIDFDEANESHQWQCGCEGDEDHLLGAVPVADYPDISELHHPPECPWYEAEEWGEVMELAPQVRAAVAANWRDTLALLDSGGRHRQANSCWEMAALWGCDSDASREQVADALARSDTEEGVGAAALDHLVWSHPELCGALGERLDAAKDLLDEQEWVDYSPTDLFVLDRGLNERTTTHGEDGRLRLVAGTYQVVAGSYRSAWHTGHNGLIGWRTLSLAPYDSTNP